MSEIPEAAVEAGADSLYDDLFLLGLSGTDAANAVENCIAAALPHIRRAVIEELIAKYGAGAQHVVDTYGLSYAKTTTRYITNATCAGLLRAELKPR